MKAWLLNEPGSLDGMTWGEIETPVVHSGELLVAVKAVALNPVDYKVAQNGNPAWEYPHIVGVDLAGEVVSLGEGAGFSVGDRVAIHTNLSRKGAFAEYAAVDARAAALIPEDVSYEEASGILCAGMTAYEAVVQKLNTTQKETILVHAGAGGVGGFAIQLAKQLGLKVYTTASKENHEWVKSLGADIAIDYKEEDVTARILEETAGRGMDLILNTVGRDVATADLERLAFSGQLAFIAGPPDTSGVKPFSLSPSIHEVALGAAHASKDERAIRNLSFMASELMEMIKDKKLNPLITEVLPHTELVEGLKKLQSRHVRGKIIVTF
ncbi:NADPH:quinone reductase-like Zn-dependent oxidoreductase [Bacillus tianshenii]|uniref:NADPH:quinone reductase-like Zn-dependent oxidoreductase n=1 Tax=Sutcliffiella tianshenii TaxID=1463404 RepID=A0ABS2NVT9_9BACI|nr:zinc-binding dehydrogenase [Bacillus tianshenii]MBM7618765.1 NADPH:quinone reductase-like Zn-dependent oxidoreductase [Bacillus tianshenii]